MAVPLLVVPVVFFVAAIILLVGMEDLSGGQTSSESSMLSSTAWHAGITAQGCDGLFFAMITLMMDDVAGAGLALVLVAMASSFSTPTSIGLLLVASPWALHRFRALQRPVPGDAGDVYRALWRASLAPSQPCSPLW